MNDNPNQPVSALTIVPAADVQKLDDTAEHYEVAIRSCKHRFERAFLLAEAMIKLRELLTPQMMTPIMGLMNNRLGFLTDKNPSRPNRDGSKPAPYSIEVVRDCAIEAMMQGVRLVDNEFNIISGGSYITRNGFTRKLRDYEDLTDLKIVLGVPRYNSEKTGVVVTCKATWKLKGQAGDLEADIPIRTDSGSTVDNLLGKADRKFKARIYAQLTGSELGEGEVEDLPAGTKNVTGTAEAGTVFSEMAGGASTPADASASPATEPAAQAPAVSPAEAALNDMDAAQRAARAGKPLSEGASPSAKAAYATELKTIEREKAAAVKASAKPQERVAPAKPVEPSAPAAEQFPPLSAADRKAIIDKLENSLMDASKSMFAMYKAILKDPQFAPVPPMAIDTQLGIDQQPDAILRAGQKYVASLTAKQPSTA